MEETPRLPRELYLRFGPGLIDAQQTDLARLGEGSVNFYPSDEGEYLQNYPGRTDYFQRNKNDSYIGTPPSLSTSITRMTIFLDFRGKEHLVFVQGANLCESYGNGFRVLYTFLGQPFSDRYYPAIFVHAAKLIIANHGDPVLMWDGLENVHPLGVQEAGLPPEVRVSLPPFVAAWVYGAFAYATYWWTQKAPISGPSKCKGADGTTRVSYYGEAVIQFEDKYGNKGRCSPPSRIFEVKPEYDPVLYEGAPAYFVSEFAVADYYPPLVEDHITGVTFGRTLNLNPDGGLGSHGIYYKESHRQQTVYNRITMQATDAVLTAGGLIDTLVSGPPQASGGCSWKELVVLWGLEDANVVAISDDGFFGQFRGSRQFRANDNVRAGVPMGDRLAVITRSTVEVLYLANDGSLGVLQQDFANGSLYGRSFVDVGDGTIFGLWNRGFAFYNGETHDFVECPYYLKALYLDERFHVQSAVKANEWYILTVRKDLVSAKNNYMILYHLTVRQWYLIEESVFDLCFWDNKFYGCDNSIYQLFRGTYSRPAVVSVRGLIPQGSTILSQRSVMNLRLLLQPSSSAQFGVDLTGEFNSNEAESDPTFSLPSAQSVDRARQPVDHWGKVNLLYSDRPRWIAPRDVWITPVIGNSVAGYSHSVKVTFPVGHLVKIKALGIVFGVDQRTNLT